MTTSERFDRLLRPDRTTVYPAVILALWPVAWSITLGFGSQPIIVDFIARWTGGRLLASGRGVNLYEPASQLELQRGFFPGGHGLSWFVSPPYEAIVLAPIGVVPFALAGVLWTAASLAAWSTSLLLLREALRPGTVDWRRFIVIVMAAFPVMELFFSGQNTAFVLLWLVLAYRALGRGRNFAAGALLGLALIKPHLVVLIPVLWVLERRWSALIGLALTSSLWVALSLVVLGPNAFNEWLSALQSGLFVSDVHMGQTLKNAGLSGLLTAVVPSEAGAPWGSLATIASLVIGAVAILMIWRRAQGLALRWWLTVLVAVLAAPHAMVYDFILVVPGVALALRHWWVRPLRVATAVTWLSFWVYPPIALAGDSVGLPQSLTHVPWHAVTLLALAVLILERLGTQPACEPPRPPHNSTLPGIAQAPGLPP